MKYTLISLLLLIQTAFASEWDQYFKDGNEAYAEGKYDVAVNQYLKILDNNIESGELFLNLGNAYYKLDEIGRAILYYEKASDFLNGDESLNQNLQIARLKIIDEIEPVPKLFFYSWWDEMIHILSIENIGWLTLIFFFLFAVIISVYVVFGRRFLLKFVWILGVICCLFIIIYAGRIYEFETTQFGIIFDKKISVVSEPGLGSSELFILHEGTKVKINRTIDDWFEITIADGKTGWCKSRSIGII